MMKIKSKTKLSFFVIIILILSFYMIPSALSVDKEQTSTSSDPGQVSERETMTEEERQRLDEQRRELIRKEMEEQRKRRESLKKQTESQEPETPEAEQPETAQPEAEKEPAPPPLRPHTPGTVSFFFDDADVFEVIQTVFADILKENYIIDPRVRGRVNFRTVTPIPKDEVLPIIEIILRLNGIGFVEERGLYNIIPLEQVSKELVYAQIGRYPEEVAIELFTFKNVDLKESMLDIENALGLNIKGGTVRILPIYRLNALLVVASSKLQLDYIRKWIEVFDEMFVTARPKIFVYPLQNSKAEHIASLLQSIFSGSTSVTPSRSTPRTPTSPQAGAKPSLSAPKFGSTAVVAGTGFLVSPETRIFADEVTNSLIILAIPSDYDFIEETIKKLDTVPRQVLIEGLIARVDLSDSLSFGFAWSLRTDISYEGWPEPALTGELGQNPSILTAEGAEILSGSGFTLIGIDTEGIVRARLEALASEGKVEVLASPHILVSDNREASIQVGQQIPIPTSETNITGTTSIQRTFQYKDIGIILKVKPQINESGLVALEITQEVSSSATPIEEISEGTVNPVINKTEATTYLVAKDNQTIIIGGLIREDKSRSRTGIPLLSKIPILGYLFGSTSDTTGRVELVILLTPRVIRSLEEAKDVTKEYVDEFRKPDKSVTIENLIKERLPEE